MLLSSVPPTSVPPTSAPPASVRRFQAKALPVMMCRCRAAVERPCRRQAHRRRAPNRAPSSMQPSSVPPSSVCRRRACRRVKRNVVERAANERELPLSVPRRRACCFGAKKSPYTAAPVWYAAALLQQVDLQGKFRYDTSARAALPRSRALRSPCRRAVRQERRRRGCKKKRPLYVFCTVFWTFMFQKCACLFPQILLITTTLA